MLSLRLLPPNFLYVLVLVTFFSAINFESALGQSTLSDTIVARFNKNDYKGVYSLGSSEFKKNENEEWFIGFLARLKKQTGQITAVSVTEDCGDRKGFKWTGEKKNLRVDFLSKSVTSFDDYFINDFIEQSHPTIKRSTDNPLKTSTDILANKYASYYMADSNAVGLSMGVFKDGKVYIYNYGEVKKGTNVLPTSNSFYELGSISKTFIATLLAQATIDKKVNLTDDIRKYLPGKYSNLEYEGQPIRLVHLTNHTSGLPESPRNFPWDSIGKLNQSNQFKYFEKYTKDSLFKDLHSLKLNAIPGTKYNYNGNAYHVLIAILERVYNSTYEQILTNYFKNKFQMIDTKNNLSPTELRRFVQGYNNEGQEMSHFNNPKTMTGGPGLNSTVSDMMKYMRENLANRNNALKLTHQLTWGKQDGFALGLGWMMNSKCNGDRYFYHSGRSRGCNSICSFYPDKNMGFVILVNETVNQGRLFVLEGLLAREIEVKKE